MKKSVLDFVLLENKQLNKDNFFLKLKSDKSLSDILPGQFINIEIKNAGEIFLRRPFSILDVDYDNNTISLLVKILGRGSKKLTESIPESIINGIFPLGNSFTLPGKNDKILLIGGGSGVAPMLFLSKLAGLKAENISLIIGARTSKDHIDVSDYNSYSNIFRTTEDGSLGEKGYVTDHSIFKYQITEFSKIYTCGPDLMMKSIGKKAREHSIFCEVSLENMMACGFGVCLCCVENTVSGHKCVCTDGPVFNVKDLKW